MNILTEAELQAGLEALGDPWQVVEGRLTRSWRLSNFDEALRWVNALGELAEAHRHHPDLALGWGYVRLSLWTHDAGGLTALDLRLASAIADLKGP